MTKRERELLYRHLDTLTDMKDRAWSNVHRHQSDRTGDMLQRHDALSAAVASLRADLARDEAEAVKTAA